MDKMEKMEKTVRCLSTNSKETAAPTERTNISKTQLQVVHKFDLAIYFVF